MLSNQKPPVTLAACAKALRGTPSPIARREIQELLKQPQGSLELEGAHIDQVAAVFSRASKLPAPRTLHRFDLLNKLIEHLGVDALVNYLSNPRQQSDEKFFEFFPVFLNAVAKGDPKVVQGLLGPLKEAGLIDRALEHPDMSSGHRAFVFHAIGKASTNDAQALLWDPRAQTALDRVVTEGGPQDITMTLTPYLIYQSTPITDILESLHRFRPAVYDGIKQLAEADPDGPAALFMSNDAIGRAAYALHVKNEREARGLVEGLLQATPPIKIGATTRPAALFKILAHPASKALLPELFAQWTPEAIFDRLSSAPTTKPYRTVRQLYEETCLPAWQDISAALKVQHPPLIYPVAAWPTGHWGWAPYWENAQGGSAFSIETTSDRLHGKSAVEACALIGELLHSEKHHPTLNERTKVDSLKNILTVARENPALLAEVFNTWPPALIAQCLFKERETEPMLAFLSDAQTAGLHHLRAAMPAVRKSGLFEHMRQEGNENNNEALRKLISAASAEPVPKPSWQEVLDKPIRSAVSSAPGLTL